MINLINERTIRKKHAAADARLGAAAQQLSNLRYEQAGILARQFPLRRVLEEVAPGHPLNDADTRGAIIDETRATFHKARQAGYDVDTAGVIARNRAREVLQGLLSGSLRIGDRPATQPNVSADVLQRMIQGAVARMEPVSSPRRGVPMAA